MRFDLYSRLNQQFIDAAMIGTAFFSAFFIRFDGAIPPYHRHQLWVLVLPIIVGRLLCNYLFGLPRIQWRYIGVNDVFYLSRAYLAFSAAILAVRFVLPSTGGILRIPASVIFIELLLSLLGAMGIRFLRRYVYEHPLSGAGQENTTGPRRLLLVGAGMIGANAAREMASDPSVDIIGFLDDDPRKWGCIIAGAKVLGPTAQLTEIVRRAKVDAVLVCIAPAARGSFNRLVALLDGLPVTSKFVPTITEILDSKDGLHLGVCRSGIVRDDAAIQATQTVPQVTTPAETIAIRNKCVLITGGAGFIGSTLAERLAKDNQILLVDRFFQNQPVSFTSLPNSTNVRMIECDILEGSIIEDLAKEADIVIHAAAIVGVGRVCTYPRETLETNFIGTSRILKASEKNSHLERFVYFSTSEVFGVNSFRVQEDTPTAVGSATEARWSYAIAKLAGEHLVKAYHRQVGMPVVTVRPFNVFGPRRLGAHAILGFTLNALAGIPLEIHGDGSQIRSWCYIEDFCDGILEMISRRSAVGEDFNIGNPQNTLTILQLAHEILETTNSAASITFVKGPCRDIEVRVPSLTKAQQILDYQPRWDLRRGLRLTTDWYREQLDCLGSKRNRAFVVAAGAARPIENLASEPCSQVASAD